MNNEKIYVICPVRKVTPEEKQFLDSYVVQLEAQGNKVHYPPRDVRQDDATGMNIVMAHSAAMRWCSQVHAFWNPASEGSVFDLGMLVMAEKPLKLINESTIEIWLNANPHKSYTRVAYELAKKSKL